jgi:hypothetical protein
LDSIDCHPDLEVSQVPIKHEMVAVELGSHAALQPRDLWLWLNTPFDVPAIVPGEVQLILAFR